MATRTILKQRIALDGGKEIEAEFAKLGRAGENAIARLRNQGGRRACQPALATPAWFRDDEN